MHNHMTGGATVGERRAPFFVLRGGRSSAESPKTAVR